jgi:hypothetical protein
MAVVGSAYIVVRAITTGFTKDVQRQLRGVDSIGRNAGSSMGKSFARSFASSGKIDFSPIADRALAAREKLTSLVRAGIAVNSIIGTIIPALGALVGGLGSLIGGLVAATPAAIALAGGLTAIGLGAIAARLALGGVGAAVSKLVKQQGGAGNEAADKAAKRRIDDAKQSLKDVIRRNAEALREADRAVALATRALTKAQLELNEALEEGREELQQINFDAEDAALAEKRAALQLEKARETLLRVQDLPPNSRARKEAELAYAEAELNLRRAKDRNSDLAKEQKRLAETGVEGLSSVIRAREAAAQAEDRLQEAQTEKANAVINAAEAQKRAEKDLQRAQEDAAEARRGGAGDDPLAGLTESQAEFAKYLASLKPLIDELKESVAAAFLPQLREAIDQIVKGPAFGVIRDGLTGIGDALGKASMSLSDAIIDAKNLTNLQAVFKTSEAVIRDFGKILGNVYGFALSALAIADPQIRGLFTFLETKTKGWDEWLKTDQGKKEFKKILKVATGIVADVSKIIGDLTKAFFNIGLSGAAQPLLDYFKDVAKSFKEFSKTTEAKKLFTSLSVVSAQILDSVGRWIGEIIKVGADPNLGKFFDILGDAAPIFGEILTEILKAAPAIGEFITAMLELIMTFTQAEQLVAFFKVLIFAIDAVNAVLNSRFIKPLIDGIAMVLGAFTALGVIFQVVSFLFLALVGQILLNRVAWMALKFSLKILGGVLNTVIGAFKRLAAVMLANPIGVIIVIIGLLVAAFIYAYNNSEEFRERVNAAFAAVREFIGNAIARIREVVEGVFNWIRDNWPLLLAILTGPIGLAVLAITRNWDTIVDGVRGLVRRITDGLRGLWDGLVNGLRTAWEGAQRFFETIVRGVMALPGRFGTALRGLWDGLANGLRAAWDVARNYWNNFVGGRGFSISIPDWVPVFGGRDYNIRIPRLAQGGVAMPVPGGILANIAEGGRPERIEPLDPDGLSKRDKAIIKELAAKQAGPTGGGSNMVFNIYPSAGMDERALAEMISRKISFMMRKGVVA